MARDEKDYMTNPSLIQRVTSYITQGGRPEYQEATEHPKTLSVYNEPYAKQNGAALGTFEYYVDDNGRLTKGVADVGISDPFTKINSQIDMNVSLQAPKVKIDGNRVVVQAPKEILSSPLVSQIKEELRTLKGSDLKSAEVQNAIKALNEEISTGLKDSLLNSATGWTRDQYNDYQYARQSVAGTNPMKSSNKIKGYDKDGNIIMKTPQEWVDYYRQFYNTDERGKAYEKSFYSSDPYERTMALVMGQGNKVPVYGFDTTEKTGEGWKALVNQMGKFPEDTFRLLAEDNDTKRLDGIVNNKKIPVESMRKFNVNTEDEFNAKKESIKGKSWDELSDDDKAFIAILGVSREGELERGADTAEAMKDYRGSRTNTFAWDTNQQDYERAERKAARQISTEDLNNATSDDKEKSRDAIDKILSDNSFEKYRTARNNYDTWQGYQDWTEEGERELASTADWSGSEQWWGNLAGTIGRYLWENAVVQGLTGGVSAKSLADPRLIRGTKAGGFAMNAVSDKIGAHIVRKLAQNGIAPTSRLGRNAMQFTANLIGTIPEDILQTSVDNVLTYNIEDNTALLDPQQMSENFRNNLIFMAGFNALRAGLSAVNRARLAKQIAKAADLDEELVIGKFADADDVARAASKGQEIKVDGEKVSTVDVDGNETVLKNTTPEEANIAQQAIRPQETAETVTTVTEEVIEPVKKKTGKEWKENPTYDQDYSLRRAEDVMEGRATLDDYLEEQKERMWEALKNSNQGTETFYHRDGAGQIDGRNTVSYNGTLYRQLYEEYGGRPTKAEFGEAFDDVIKNGENSKYYEGFKEFDVEGDYSRGYNAGNEEIDAILALKGDVESAPAKATENAPEPEPEIGAARTEVEEPGVETETTRVETAAGETLGEAPDIRVRNVDDGLKMRISPTPPNVRALHAQTLGAAMRDFSQVHLPEFQRRFPGVEVSDFDWVFHNTRNGLEPNQIVGMIDPETGREVTDQMIEAMQWFGDQPFMKDLRKASRDALGLEGDFNMLGYLPHSTYDPSNLSFDEALTGQLWRQYTGASMIGENGQYKGFGGDFNSRYRTFASNMLWDARGKDVAAAKLMEEAEMDGKSITPEQAVRAVEGQQDIQRKVSDSATTKELEAALSSDTDVDEIDFKKIDEATKKQAQNSGLGKAIHDNYSEVYYGANSATVAKQSGATRQAFDTLGNTMRNTQIIDGRGRRMSLYDWGGADFVYAERNAIELVNRYMREGGDLRDMLIEFVENHSHRTTEYAEAVADRWMGKLGDTPGRLTKAAAIRSLSGSMKWEAMGRIRKFLTMAKYDEFNSATKKTIDSFLFGHMQMDTIKTSQKIGKKLSSALNAMTSMRYRALFYGNVKNALLQTSELNRLFTTFKWGDVATMAKRMATDANFKARVDDIYDAVAPQQSSFRSALYDDYAEVAGDMKTTQEGVSLKDGGKRMVEAVDNIGLAPIEAAEAFKNRMMVAALVQEADSLGLTGDEALRHIRNRFERVALAMDELGRIGMASNPIARTALFLQNFQIRELGMHIYNLSDELFAKNTKLPKRLLNASKYLSKVLGTKLATTLILARLGYSASQTLGYDPFGVLENYTGMDEEDMGGFDYFMRSPLFAGGMTSLLADMYFMARKAYEESSPKTISEEAEEEISGDNRDFFERTFSPLSRMAGLSFDDLMGLGQNFVPGNVFFNRINQMNEMMDTGWATSMSGNKMYTAPSDALNTILGYLFGRSATQNAQQYSQTYGDNLWQTLGRMRPGRGFGEFDPIDSKNYSDWFKGDGNDKQQFEKGRRYFQQQRDRILDEYENAIRKSYASNDDIAEAKNNMNQSLEDLYNQLDRFVDAYEKKNGTIDSAMTKQIINLLNTGRDVLGDTPEQAQERSLEEYNKALERYSQGGFSPVGTYTGPSGSQPNKEVKYQGSPQYRTAVSGKYTLNSEAVAVLKEADKVLSDVRKELKQAVSDAYDAKDYDKLAEVQKQYLTLFDKAVAPVIATYGNGILSSTDVVNQLKDMLSTGTVSRSGDLIPSDQYRKDKYGRYRSMPLETVDVKKWAQQRYSDDIYKQPTVRSYTAAGDDIMDIRRLINQGKPDRARARALQLKVRVDNQKRTISPEDYNWLLDFLNNGGE